MADRRFLAQVTLSTGDDRYKPWGPTRSIYCCRKLATIANDRCLEYQASDGCLCPQAAMTSRRDAIAEPEAP